MLKNFFIKTISFYIWNHLKNLKHCYYEKIYLQKLKYSNNLCQSIQNEKEKLFVGGLSLSTSMWYQTNKEEIEENIVLLINLAKYALERGDLDRAKEILQLGLQLSEEHEIYSGAPYIYDILTAIALAQGNIYQAQSLLSTAIEKLTIWGFPEDHNNVIDFKLRLARIYSTSGQNSLAQLGFESCLSIQKTKILNGDTTEKTGLLYINILFWYGVHKIRNHHYPEARSMINTAYEFSTKIKGLSPKQEMIILYTLSDLNAELGDFDTALKYILNAIVLGKGIGSVDLPLCYLKLGAIYEHLNFMEQAKCAYEQAANTAKIFGFSDIVSEAEDALQELVDIQS